MSVSRETKRQTYVALLERWGSALNLTSGSRRSKPALEELIEDCLCVLPHLPSRAGRLIDLGSGQGFPAIPIAIETGITIDLIEADRRKAAFLATTLATLELAGSVHAVRIDAACLEPAPCVTARALAPLADLITLAKPFLSAGGSALFLKGATVAQELCSIPTDTTTAIDIFATSRPPSTLVKVTFLS